MGKIHPILSSTSTTTTATTAATTTSPSGLSTLCSGATSATFTMWMKSLVMNGNGCTIYDENGGVVYRVDNYQTKGGREVCLMDLKGNLVFTIIKTGGYSLLCPFRSRKWKGYRCDDETAAFEVVRKRRAGAGVVVISCDGGVKRFEMEASSAGKLTAFKITDVVNGGVVVAEAKRKQTGNGGVLLGDDVLTLVVRPGVDRSFVMGLATVYGLMSRRL